jgi:hypothetical protein
MPLPQPVSTSGRTRRVPARQAAPIVTTDEVVEELKQIKAALITYRKLIEKIRRDLAA